ncbi:MAG: hypothetical protein IJE14_08910 [Clostridia bacterium]|nr:hypothetical protein [Clostridia bacterium]
MHDDSDIKIFKGKGEDSDSSDLFALAEEMRRNIVNGNSAKAKELGTRLASLSPDSDDLGEELIKYVRNTAADEEVKDQIVTLMLFCAEYTLLNELCPMLAASATETMYNVIKANFPSFYNSISNGAAVSFYHLAVKKNREVAKAVGESFAMLCEQDSKLIKAMGENVFTLTCEKVKETIAEYKFEK